MTVKPFAVNGNFKNFFHNNAKILFASAIFLLAYVPTLIWMWDRWFARDSYYSHGILIPFVTGYLIWLKKDELVKIPHVRSSWGIPFIIVGILVHMMSSLFRVYFTSGFSMLFVIYGLILHFYGSQTLKKIVFPISFLIFMLPVPLVIIANISFKMKVFAAEIAQIVLHKMGFVAIREGSIIRMQHATVIVDDVCSGLRSLISLTALGSIFAYWMNSTMTRRIILFLCTIPIAIVTNVIRIILLSTVSEIWGPEIASGFIHDASGFMVFAIAFLMLFGAGRLLE